MALPLEVLADLTLAVDGENIDVRGEGDVVVVDLPNLRAGRRLLNSGPWTAAERQTRSRQFNEALQIAGLTIDVRLHGETVARIGAKARPNAIARFLNLGDVEVRAGETVKAEARRRPLLTLGIITGVVALLAYLFFRSPEE
jgi:hypothetical protein